MTIEITYKNFLNTPKPYPRMTTEEYLSNQESTKNQLYDGTRGIYLARKVNMDGQELYFPYIDIDGDSRSPEDEKINSAIAYTRLTLETLTRLQILDKFLVIATGNTGFRIVSNILLDQQTYLAFADFVAREMPHILDLKPTKDIEMPHQMFVYKGHANHNNHGLVDRHSVIVPRDAFLCDELSVSDYKSLTVGKMDPDSVMHHMEEFLKFRPVADLNSLGKFGKTLKEYLKIRENIVLDVFDISKWPKKDKPVSLDALKEMLSEKGIPCKIEKRGLNDAISFRGLPCPLCKKTTVNAVAYPPNYRLFCFNSNCAANNRVPFAEWSGIHAGANLEPSKKKNSILVSQPTDLQTLM